MAGAPSQLNLFDYKPKLIELNNHLVPDSFIKGERFAFIKGVPKLLGTPHEFKKHGQSGIEISSALCPISGPPLCGGGGVGMRPPAPGLVENFSGFSHGFHYDSHVLAILVEFLCETTV